MGDSGINANQIDACGMSFDKPEYKFNCMSIVSSNHLQPEQINSCRQGFDLDTEKIRCLSDLNR